MASSNLQKNEDYLTVNFCISSKMEDGLLTLTKGERLSFGKLLLIMKDGR
jgi:hypothetical protein